MSRRDDIRQLYSSKPEPAKLATANSTQESVPEKPERVLAGPVRTMGLSLDRMHEQTRAVHDALAKGLSVIEIDPGLIDASFVRDRLEGDENDFERFKQSIEARGQEVPILVRPHPQHEGRYQVAYGHRRLRAVSQLGRKVRTVVKQMDDAELVVAQGVENSARKDLSYIEKAVFAHRLEKRGFNRLVIMDALSTDKGELSKLISVARAVPEELVQAIGPAPAAGRRRWLWLSDLIRDKSALRAAEKSVGVANFASLDTDTRFARVLTAASPGSTSRPKPSFWKGSDGAATAKISRVGNTVTVAIERQPEFGDFVVQRLGDLYEEFRAKSDGPAPDESVYRVVTDTWRPNGRKER